eukprot:6417306-Pyramimonas_sp.AAC.1
MNASGTAKATMSSSKVPACGSGSTMPSLENPLKEEKRSQTCASLNLRSRVSWANSIKGFPAAGNLANTLRKRWRPCAFFSMDVRTASSRWRSAEVGFSTALASNSAVRISSGNCMAMSSLRNGAIKSETPLSPPSPL